MRPSSKTTESWVMEHWLDDGIAIMYRQTTEINFANASEFKKLCAINNYISSSEQSMSIFMDECVMFQMVLPSSRLTVECGFIIGRTPKVLDIMVRAYLPGLSIMGYEVCFKESCR